MLRLDAKIDNLPQLLDWVEREAAEAGLVAPRRMRVLIALEEAFVNICHYAYPGGEGEVLVACGGEQERFVVEVADFGEPFDVLSLPEPDLEADVAQRKVGGLGVYCIRNLATEVDYRREGKRNILRMVFPLA